MLAEVVGRDAVECHRPGRGLGGAVGSADAVLVQPRRAAVADHNQPVTKGRARRADVDARVAVADVAGNHAAGEAPGHLRRAEEAIHQLFVDVVAQQAQRRVVALGDQRREFQSRDVQQEDVHRRTERLPDDLLAELELADEGLGERGGLMLLGQAFQRPGEAAVHAAGDHHEVIVRVRAVGALHPHEIIFLADVRDQLADQPRAPVAGELLQVAVEAVRVERLGVAGPVAPIDGGDAALVQGRGDLHVADVHVQGVGLEAALHHVVRQGDALGRQSLDQGLGDHAAAVVASGGTAMAEMAGLVEVHLQVQRHAFSHVQQEVAEHRSGGTRADDRYPCPVLQGLGRLGSPGLRTLAEPAESFAIGNHRLPPSPAGDAARCGNGPARTTAGSLFHFIRCQPVGQVANPL